MYSVYYKFKSAKDFDTISIDTPEVPLGKLKQLIVQQKKLGKLTDFDLVITNSQTKEEYRDDDTKIQRNAALLVQRVPIKPGQKPLVYQIQESTPKPAPSFSNPPVAAPLQPISAPLPSFPVMSNDNIPTQPATATQQLTEDEKLKSFLNQDTSGWLPETYQGGNSFGIRKTTMKHRVPPPNYVCHRCKKTGHYIQFCPTNGDPNYDIKRLKAATGIPKNFLKTAQASDGRAEQLVQDGTIAYLAPNESAFKKEFGNTAAQFITIPTELVPEDLKCPLCNQIIKNAVDIPCCGRSFCDECISNYLVEVSNFTCPQCKTPEQYVDALLPNFRKRHEIDAFTVQYKQSNKNQQQPAETKLQQTNQSEYEEEEEHLEESFDENYENKTDVSKTDSDAPLQGIEQQHGHALSTRTATSTAGAANQQLSYNYIYSDDVGAQDEDNSNIYGDVMLKEPEKPVSFSINDLNKREELNSSDSTKHPTRKRSRSPNKEEQEGEKRIRRSKSPDRRRRRSRSPTTSASNYDTRHRRSRSREREDTHSRRDSHHSFDYHHHRGSGRREEYHHSSDRNSRREESGRRRDNYYYDDRKSKSDGYENFSISVSKNERVVKHGEETRKQSNSNK